MKYICCYPLTDLNSVTILLLRLKRFVCTCRYKHVQRIDDSVKFEIFAVGILYAERSFNETH